MKTALRHSVVSLDGAVLYSSRFLFMAENWRRRFESDDRGCYQYSCGGGWQSMCALCAVDAVDETGDLADPDRVVSPSDVWVCECCSKEIQPCQPRS
jgi:hypothetical protein